MLRRIAIAVVAVTLGSAAIATDAVARGGGGHGGGGMGGSHFGGGFGGGHFSGAMGGGRLGGGHFGAGRFAGGFEHGRFGRARGLGVPFGYYDGYADDQCWPLDRIHLRRPLYLLKPRRLRSGPFKRVAYRSGGMRRDRRNRVPNEAISQEFTAFART